MVNVTSEPQSVFSLPWSRDPEGYRVIRTVGELEALGERITAWPDSWPEPVGGWLANMLEDARRLEPAGEFPGGGLIFPVSEDQEACDPLDDTPDLWRWFVECGHGPDEVRAFADRYGLLWHDGPLTLAGFRAAQDEMRELGESAAAIHSRRISPQDESRYERYLKASDRLNASLSDDDLSARFRLRIVRAKRRKASTLQLVPDDLLSAITLQVAELAAGGVEWGHCRWCHKPFPAGPGGIRRKGSVYCSTECEDTAHSAGSVHRRKRNPHPYEHLLGQTLQCPYCLEEFEMTRRKRTPAHCGKPKCKTKHSAAAQDTAQEGKK